MSNKRVAEFIPADDISDVFETYTGDPQNNEQTSQQRKFEDILSDLNDDTDEAEIRIYRQGLSGKTSMVLLEALPVDKYTLTGLWAMIRDRYGAGNYRIHVRQHGKLLANKLLEVETPRTEQDNQGGPLDGVNNILSGVMDRMDRQHAMMMELMQANKPHETSRKEMLEEMMLYKQLFDNGSGNSPDPIKQIKDTVELLGNLGVGLGNNEEDEPGFNKLLEKMADFATVAVQQPNQQYQQNPSPRPTQDKTVIKQMMINSGLKVLLNAAAKDADPGMYCDVVLDQVPESVVKEYLLADNAMEQLIKVAPQAAEYQPWFNELIENIKFSLGLPSKFDEPAPDLTGEEEPSIKAAKSDEEKPGEPIS